MSYEDKPNFDQLIERVVALEEKGLKVEDLPVKQLQDRLELDWLPDPGALLAASSIDDSLIEPTAVVTALPTNPRNGQEINYLADDTNGVVWRLKYRAASASSYKWEFVGGGSLSAAVATDQSFAADSTSRDLATVGPQITLPLAGDYEYTAHANMYNAGAANVSVVVQMALAGVDLASPHLGQTQLGVAGGAGDVAVLPSTVTASAASQVLKMRYYGTGGGTAHARWRVLRVRPIRVT